MAALKVLLVALVTAVVGANSNHKFVTEVRQKFKPNINDAIVGQIQKELTASYVYQAYASWFGRADVALPGFQKFFSEASKEERDHAQKLIDYVNMRGGHVQYHPINFNDACDVMANATYKMTDRSRACICEFLWTQSRKQCGASQEIQYGLQAMEDALALERYVNDLLLSLHQQADDAEDPHLTHVLEHEFLEEQVTSIRELAGYVTRLRSFKSSGYALGEYMFDQKLQS
ncbi:hypothetical protein BaRGS_00026703 [Batillaria attramentaria]|uniref:Ferritin n=1 Tax=Batillaria attramentaria TaxID=370345 RepID=A0ABD0K5A6_9CAEN|nr:hypothetical protein BaRGS_013401 [Batillaria attramentaria]